MRGPSRIPGINDAATKEELDKMFKDLMAQESDMEKQSNDFPDSKAKSSA